MTYLKKENNFKQVDPFDELMAILAEKCSQNRGKYALCNQHGFTASFQANEPRRAPIEKVVTGKNICIK